MSEGFTLDHVGVAVRDLAQAHAAFVRLGFRPTKLSQHTGQADANGVRQKLGSGNHCAMLRLGYIELIGVVDPSQPSSVAPFLESRDGGFIMALGCKNADATYAAAVQEFPSTQPPLLLERAMADEAGGMAMARFRNVIMGASFPEARLILIEHMTRDLVWRDAEMMHPNGAVALLGARFLVADRQEAAARYSRLIGETYETEGDALVLRFAGQEIRFIEPAAAAWGGKAWPHCPSLYGAILGVTDIDMTARILAENGTSFERRGDEMILPPESACGFSLTFRPLK